MLGSKLLMSIAPVDRTLLISSEVGVATGVASRLLILIQGPTVANATSTQANRKNRPGHACLARFAKKRAYNPKTASAINTGTTHDPIHRSTGSLLYQTSGLAKAKMAMPTIWRMSISGVDVGSCVVAVDILSIL